MDDVKTTPQIKPDDILSSSEVSYLREKNSTIGVSLVLHAWIVILGSIILFSLYPNILTFILAVLIISGRQLGLAILMHEGAHGLITNNVKINNFISQLFCAFPMGGDTYDYRYYHLRHHRYTQTEEDPDLVLSSPFPISKKSLLRKVLRDLFGITGVKQRIEGISRTLKKQSNRADGKEVAGFKSQSTLYGVLFSQIIIFIVMSYIGSWWYYFAFWVFPSITLFQLWYRVRNIAEHAVVDNDCDDFNNARTTHASFIERIFVAPYYVNYHLEHHLFMFVPCYKLKSAHQMLIDKNYKNRMEIKYGYIALLKAILV